MARASQYNRGFDDELNGSHKPDIKSEQYCFGGLDAQMQMMDVNNYNAGDGKIPTNWRNEKMGGHLS